MTIGIQRRTRHPEQSEADSLSKNMESWSNSDWQLEASQELDSVKELELPNTETEQDPESDSDEELTKEPVEENEGRWYPLRASKTPRYVRMKSLYCWPTKGS